MIRALVAVNRGVATPVVRHGLTTGSQQASPLLGSNRPTLRMLWPRKSSRNFSTGGRGSRQGNRSAKKSTSSEVQAQEGRTAEGTAKRCGAAVMVAVVIWQANQDTAPFTNRKRFMLINRDGRLLKGVTANSWYTLKSQFASRILPKTHPTTRRVEKIGARIVEASGLKGNDWEFLVVEDEDTMNAFALPGGKVVVFTGLLETTPNDDALAAVLGHEVGHILANHGGEKLSKRFAKEGLVLLFVLAMEIDSYPGYVTTRSFGNLVFDLYYLPPNSREMESEADYIGMQLMAKACFDPHEMPRTFSRMIAEDNKRGISRDSHLATHPSTEERIAMQKKWMGSAVKTRSRSRCPDLARWGLG